MLDTILRRLNEQANGYEARARERRAVTPHDPVADALDFCAKSLRRECEAIRLDTADLSVREWAALNHASEQAVRLWIRRGEVKAAKDAAGEWRIGRDVKRERKAKAKPRADLTLHKGAA
jgi:hypothetical protein